ncbi:MAG: hypothetical protein ABFD64_01000 [Armatimonadota bacterium]
MILRKPHIGPTAPVSLVGKSALKVALPTGASNVEIGAALYSHQDAVLHFRISTDANLTATTLANEECSLTFMGSQLINLHPANQYYAYVLLTDLAGANISGGDNDRIILLAEGESIR